MEKKIRNLVLAKHFILKNIMDVAWNEKPKQFEKSLARWSINFSVLSDLLNIEIDTKDLIHKKYDFNKFFSSYLLCTIKKDKLLDKIYNNYGIDLAALYYFYTNIVALHYITSAHTYGDLLDKAAPDRKALVSREIKAADKFIHEYFKTFSKPNIILRRHLAPEIIELLTDLVKEKDSNPVNYIKIHDITSNILDKSFPNYDDIEYSMELAEKLSDRIDNCKPGIKYWKDYGKLGIDSIQYLFLPELETIYVQKRTENGHQVRDAILPNTYYSGFWEHIRHEFSSKNIVIEFKNGVSSGIDKNSLNQLRVYLSKKTIGRFGILFIRQKPTTSLLLARKLAYEESGILILLIDDLLLKKLLACKAMTGSCTEFLQLQKIKFEIEY